MQLPRRKHPEANTSHSHRSRLSLLTNNINGENVVEICTYQPPSCRPRHCIGSFVLVSHRACEGECKQWRCFRAQPGPYLRFWSGVLLIVWSWIPGPTCWIFARERNLPNCDEVLQAGDQLSSPCRKVEGNPGASSWSAIQLRKSARHEGFNLRLTFSRATGLVFQATQMAPRSTIGSATPLHKATQSSQSTILERETLRRQTLSQRSSSLSKPQSSTRSLKCFARVSLLSHQKPQRSFS